MHAASHLAVALLAVSLHTVAGTPSSVPDYSTLTDYEFNFEEHFDGATNCFGLAKNDSGLGGAGHAGQFHDMGIRTYSCDLPSIPETDSYGTWEISFWIRGDVPKSGTSSANQVMRTDIYFEEGNHFVSHTMKLPQGEWVAHLGNNRAPGGAVVGLGEWQWLSFTVDASNYFYSRRVPARLLGRTIDPIAPPNYVNDNYAIHSSWEEPIGPRLSKLAFVNFRAIVSIDAVRIRAKNRYHLARPIAMESFDHVASPGPHGLACALTSAPHTSIVSLNGTADKALEMNSKAAGDLTYTTCDVLHHPQDGILSSWVLDLDVQWADVRPDASQFPGTEHPTAGLLLVVSFGGVDGIPETKIQSKILWEPEQYRLYGVGSDHPTNRELPFKSSAPPVVKGDWTHFEFDYSPAQWNQSSIEHVGVFATNADGTKLFDSGSFVESSVYPANANAEIVPPITKVQFITATGFVLRINNVRIQQRGLEIRPATVPVTTSALSPASTVPATSAAPASTTTTSIANPTTASPARTVGLHIKENGATIQIGSGPSAAGLFNDPSGALATENDLLVKGNDILATLASIQAELQSLSQRVASLETV